MLEPGSDGVAAAVADAMDAPVSAFGDINAAAAVLLLGSLGVIVGSFSLDPTADVGLAPELETGGGVELVSLDDELDEVDEPVLVAAAVAAGGVPE